MEKTNEQKQADLAMKRKALAKTIREMIKAHCEEAVAAFECDVAYSVAYEDEEHALLVLIDESNQW